MLKHIVCFKLKNRTDSEKKAAKEVLLPMVGKVDTIKDIEVGTDFLCSERSYDVFLAVTVESREALEAYQNDEYHVSVVKKYIGEHTSGAVAIDYEF